MHIKKKSLLKLVVASIILIAISFFIYFNQKKFHEVHSFDVIAEYLTQLDENTLVIFDVDNVLIIPAEATLFSGNKEFREKKFADMRKRLSADNYEHLKSIIEIQYTRKLVNSQIPETIRVLQDNGIKVIALSSMRTGPLGVIKERHDIRMMELGDLGIEFDRSFEDLPEHFVLQEVETELAHQPAAYRKGVICTSHSPKGEALAAFLKAANHKPARVVFIDNKAHKLESVQAICEALGIDFHGFHYLEAFKDHKPVNEDIAHYQFEYLEKNKKWLSDEEATVLMAF